MGASPDDEHPEAEDNDKYSEGEDMFILRCDAVNAMRDPRAVAECQVAALSEKPTEKPTLPLQYQNLSCDREAYDLPLWHCSFRDCVYATDSERELAQHISSNHAGIFTEVCGKAIKEECRECMQQQSHGNANRQLPWQTSRLIGERCAHFRNV